MAICLIGTARQTSSLWSRDTSPQLTVETLQRRWLCWNNSPFASPWMFRNLLNRARDVMRACAILLANFCNLPWVMRSLKRRTGNLSNRSFAWSMLSLMTQLIKKNCCRSWWARFMEYRIILRACGRSLVYRPLYLGNWSGGGMRPSILWRRTARITKDRRISQAVSFRFHEMLINSRRKSISVFCSMKSEASSRLVLM